MINNLELIKPLLNFENEGDFYMLYIFKRKKDQPEGERDNHQSVRTIRSYCIKSIEQLEKRYDEVMMMCEMFKARAYIHIQKQNHRDVSLNMMVALAQRIQDGNHEQQNLFDSVVGQHDLMLWSLKNNILALIFKRKTQLCFFYQIAWKTNKELLYLRTQIKVI